MTMYQILVRNLDGKTRCLRFPSRQVSSEDVKAELAVKEGVPAKVQRLLSGTREFGNGTILVAGEDGFFPSCSLILRLRGGKGGFGSLLRGAATKAGQKKTSNFDACRDMSGRRLRHVNAEKKLKEWKADAKERELEKTAEDFLKKHRKQEEESQGVEKDLEKFREESRNAREEIGSAVMDGLVEAAKLGVDLKRKKVEAVEFEVKKARTWSPDNLDEEDDEDDSDEEDEAGPSFSDKDHASASSSDKDEAIPSCSTKDQAHLCSSDEVADLPEIGDEQASRESSLNASRISGVQIILEYPETVRTSPVPISGNDAMDKVVEEPTISNIHSDSSSLSMARGDGGALDGHLPGQKAKDATGPLDFEDYNTSKHLEVLGLERLKVELQNRGLKCGGSLSERASRLFLLKTTPLEKLDKSLFSKPSKIGASN